MNIFDVELAIGGKVIKAPQFAEFAGLAVVRATRKHVQEESDEVELRVRQYGTDKWQYFLVERGMGSMGLTGLSPRDVKCFTDVVVDEEEVTQ